MAESLSEPLVRTKALIEHDAAGCEIVLHRHYSIKYAKLDFDKTAAITAMERAAHKLGSHEGKYVRFCLRLIAAGDDEMGGEDVLASDEYKDWIELMIGDEAEPKDFLDERIRLDFFPLPDLLRLRAAYEEGRCYSFEDWEQYMKTDGFEKLDCVCAQGQQRMYNFFIIEYDKKECKQFIRSKKSLSNFLLAAYLPEYALTAPLYVAGTMGWWKTGLAAQGCFLAFSCVFQYQVYQSGAAVNAPKELQYAYRGTFPMLENGFPFYGFLGRTCGLKSWHIQFLAAVPNYAHVPSTAVAIGGSWQAWPQHAAEFAKRWSYVPVVGGLVGSMGAPMVLTVTLGVSAVAHGLTALLAFKAADGPCLAADAANLLFLSKVFWMTLPSTHSSHSPSRIILGLMTKIPKVWMQTSLFAILFDSLAFGEKMSMTISVLLGWYALVPLLVSSFGLVPFSFDSFLDGCVQRPCETVVELPKLLVFLCPWWFPVFIAFVVILHFIGIFVCPSHDFSILHGCTPKANATGNITM